MLQNMREASKSWFVRAFFAVLVFAFVFLWGVGDVFTPGRMTDQSVATVGNVSISMSEFRKETKAKAMQTQQRTGQQIDEGLIQQQALQDLIVDALLDQEADHMGLAVSDQQVIEMITSADAFKDQSGQFSRQMFEGYARNDGLTPKDFEESLRKEMRRNQLTQLVTTGISLPNAYVSPLYKWQHEKRTVDWAIIAPTSFTNLAAPKLEELQAYYEGHHDEFTRPQERDVTIVIMAEPALRSKIKLTDEEMQAGFAARQGTLKGPLPTKDESDKIIEELIAEKSMDEFNRLTTLVEDNLAGGVTLEELAQKHDLRLVKVEGLRKDGGTRNTANLSPDVLIETIEQGFKMESGDDPFLSQLGNGEYIAARVDKIHESKLLSFEEVSKDILAIVNSENQQKAAKELANSMVEKINGGGQLAQLAKENKLELKTGVVLTRTDQKDQNISRGLRAIAFQTDLNKAAVAPGDKGSFAVVVPRSITAPKAEEMKDEDVKKFKTALEQNMVNDMYQQYLTSLQRRYKVSYNEAVLKSLQQQK